MPALLSNSSSMTNSHSVPYLLIIENPFAFCFNHFVQKLFLSQDTFMFAVNLRNKANLMALCSILFIAHSLHGNHGIFSCFLVKQFILKSFFIIFKNNLRNYNGCNFENCWKYEWPVFISMCYFGIVTLMIGRV